MKMKLRKKRKKYKLRTVSRDEILSALERWDVEIIYSWGAFCLHGLACKVGDVAFRFDFDVNPMYSLGRYLQTHTEGEIAEKICREITGREDSQNGPGSIASSSSLPAYNKKTG